MRAMARFSKTCPVCGAVFSPSDVPIGDSFPCPSCREWLTYKVRYPGLIWTFSIALTIGTALQLGLRDAIFIFFVGVGSFVVHLLTVFVLGFLFPPPAVRVEGKPFDGAVSLRLGGKGGDEKKN